MQPMLIKVRVKTGAKNESLEKVADDHFKITVREKPQGNMANRRIVELVADALIIPHARVRIVKGHHSPSKTLEIFNA
jgi:uncharacterized protein YggU (UPF0235/DUF167 family)